MARRFARADAVLRIRRSAILPLRRRAGRRRRAAPRTASARLAALYRAALRANRRADRARPRERISDLQFTARYRVPFQFSRLVREHLGAGAFVQSSSGRHGHRSRRQRLLRPDRLLRRQCLRLRLLQGMHRSAAARACATSARCSAPIIRSSPTTCGGCARSPGSTRSRSTCPAPKR